MKNLDQEGKEIIFVGDTNCDFKNNQSANTKKLKAIYEEYQLEQLIKSYTRIATTTNERNERNISKTLIEHFSTTSLKYILKAEVLELGMVDHFLVYGIKKVNAWRVQNKKPKLLETRSLSNYDGHCFVTICSRLIGKPSLALTLIILIVWLPLFRRSLSRF